jgi:hypothetical protein
VFNYYESFVLELKCTVMVFRKSHTQLNRVLIFTKRIVPIVLVLCFWDLRSSGQCQAQCTDKGESCYTLMQQKLEV